MRRSTNTNLLKQKEPLFRRVRQRSPKPQKYTHKGALKKTNIYIYIHIYIYIYIHTVNGILQGPPQRNSETNPSRNPNTGVGRISSYVPLRWMDKILHDPKDPKLWELWYIPCYGSCRILSINSMVPEYLYCKTSQAPCNISQAPCHLVLIIKALVLIPLTPLL